uniref:Uncharacterized protein n=1 Tax=Plectus sambesii TaxID=2011161 RepID=A0A914VKG1_9BILA
SVSPSPMGSTFDLRQSPLPPCAQIVVTALLNTSHGVRPRSATVELRSIKPLLEPTRTRTLDEITTARSDLNGCRPLTQSPERRMTLMRLEATNGDVF